MKYKLLVDYGKPYEEEFEKREEVISEVKRLLKLSEDEEYGMAYLDLVIFEGEKDISEEIAKEVLK